jgi:broad specificity phosphatase PhoE
MYRLRRGRSRSSHISNPPTGTARWRPIGCRIWHGTGVRPTQPLRWRRRRAFGTLLRRAEAALEQLAAVPSPGPVYVFSHGQFIQEVCAVVTESEPDDRDKMLRFWCKGEPPAIGNAELVSFVYSGRRWDRLS